MSELAQLGRQLFNRRDEDRLKIVSSEKRVRGLLDGQWIFDTTSAKLVWENKYFPFYWIPRSDFAKNVKFEDDKPISGIQQSTAMLSIGGDGDGGSKKSIPTLLVPNSFNSELVGYVKIRHADLDAWYEEQSEVLFHPKDPFHRVDILPSSRHVKVEIEGTVLADTREEGGVMSLWETNLPGRWYLPRTAVNWKYLKPSATETACPYKGRASYYNAVIDGKEYKDVVWWYPNPLQESALINGMLCFYPDKVDTWVDGKAIAKVGMPKLKQNHSHEHSNGSSCNC